MSVTCDCSVLLHRLRSSIASTARTMPATKTPATTRNWMVVIVRSLPPSAPCHSRPGEARGREPNLEPALRPRKLGVRTLPLRTPSQRFALLAGNDKRGYALATFGVSDA